MPHESVHFEDKFPHLQVFNLKSLGKNFDEEMPEIKHTLGGRYSSK